MKNTPLSHRSDSLQGKLLIAMPGMADPRFYRTVIFITTHDAEGTMGIVLNQQLPGMLLGDILKELKCEIKFPEDANCPVLLGGPVDTARGFLLHTTDYSSPETIMVNEKFALSATTDALVSFASYHIPKDMVFALGYAGWGDGQLEQEILENSWLVLDADYELIFNTPIADRWERAMSRHGIDPSRLSGEAGHA